MTDKHGMKKMKILKDRKKRQTGSGSQTQIVAQNVAFEENDEGSQFSKNGKNWQTMNGLKFTHCKFCGKKLYESHLTRHYEQKHPLIMNR